MKKVIIVGIAITSLIFAQGFMKSNNGQNNGTGMGMKFNNGQNSTLTDAQQKELLVLRTAHQKVMAPLYLNIQEKDLAIDKEMLTDKPNWTKIETLTKEKATIVSQIEILRLKNRTEMQEKFGTGFGGNFGQGKGMKGSGGKGQCMGFNK